MANSSSWSSRDCDIRYCDDLLIARRRTGIVESPVGIHSDFVINIIKGRYGIYQLTCVFYEIINEARNSNSFRKFPEADNLVVVVPLNPTSKKIPTISNHHPKINSRDVVGYPPHGTGPGGFPVPGGAATDREAATVEARQEVGVNLGGGGKSRGRI